ncbi:ABC transporter permease [Desulfonema ishimotonii]|uniref:ABC transporter permease n=1 Tax=Desulfonema ishimotonii TaxID=45657 RepID=A0A401FXT0_9BACT|nr:ABC transporter permease [Desulfonema ishimotonii]GBC61770.1 ABC transporter permease [Desulfonema ishimotonii]
MYLQLAWRNIWRNPRRTAVILMAVIIGVWSMVFLGALMDGISEQMLRNSIATLTGSLQVHHPGYRSDPVIENSMNTPAEVEKALATGLPDGAHWAPRIRVSAVASNARHSSGVTLVGIDPPREARVSFIGNAVTQGRYLEPDDPHGIVVGQALAEKFKTRPGRKLVLMSPAADREMASRAFRIVGIYRAELEATEKAFVFVTLPAARKMLKLESALSEISALLPEGTDEASVVSAIKAGLPDGYAVETWQELLPVITGYLELNRGFTFIWYLVVFIAMGFGIVNTLLMAVFERMREFGLLRALGMKPWHITAEVLTESFFLLMMGMAAGNFLSFLSLTALADTGIDLSAFAAGVEYAGMPRIIYPAVKPYNAIVANLVVLVLGLIVSLYPALKAARFTPVKAMAQH